MRFSCLCLAVAVALSGCADSGQVGRPGSNIWFKTSTPEQIAAHYQGNCESYGFTPGTEAMSSCIASEVQATKQANASMAAGIISANTAVRQPY